MNSSSRPTSRTGKFFQWLAPFSLLMLVFLSVLWKGGKTLESTWALVFVMWLVVFIAFLYPREGERRVSVLLWGTIMLYVTWTGLSWYFSSVRNYGLDELLRTASLSLLLLWAARLPLEARVRTMILRVFSVAVLIASLAGIAVYALQPANRFVGTFFDFRFQGDYWPNAWAELVLLSWPVLLYLLLKNPGNGGKFRQFLRLIFRSAPLGVVFGTLLLSYSRASIIAFVGQCAVLLVWGFVYNRGLRRGIVVIVTSMAIAVSVYGAANVWRATQYPVQSLAEKALFLADEGTTSITERMQFWKQAFAFANEKPILGWGLGSFRFVQPRAAQGVLATSDHAHNVFLKAAMDSGWPAAGLLFIVLCLILVPHIHVREILSQTRNRLSDLWSSTDKTRWLRLERRFMGSEAHGPNFTGEARGTEAALPLALFLFTAVTGVLAHNLVDYNLQFVGIILPFMLFLGFLVPAKAQGNSSMTINKCVRISELLLATLLLFIALREVPYIVTSSLGRRALARNDIPTAIRWFEKSRGEWYPRDLYLTEAQLLYQQKRYTEALKVATVAAHMNQSDARAFALLTDIDLIQNDQKAAYTHAVLAYRNGRMTDLGTMRRLVQVLANSAGKTEMDTRKADFDGVLRLFFAAIGRNAHYVAVSPSTDEFLKITTILSEWYPADEPKYQVMAAAVARIAKTEREKMGARVPGLFW
ncbi:MAG: O-antigen ligase family protein [Candidatus Peregrinibacteria bacterium]